MKTILLDGERFHFSAGDLPLLIHGQEGSGASLFSISVAADLYKQGAKLLFMSGHHMARDEFREQTRSDNESILVESESDVLRAATKRIIFVPAERQTLFVQLLKELPDIEERIVYFKNFDIFDASIFEAVRMHRPSILQGNLDKVSNPGDYKTMDWATSVYFSQPPLAFNEKIPNMPKYSGFFRQEAKNGMVSLTD